MQVSSVDVPQTPGTENQSAKISEPSGSVFATLLKSIVGQNGARLRLEAGTSLGQSIVPDAVRPRTDEYESKPEPSDDAVEASTDQTDDISDSPEASEQPVQSDNSRDAEQTLAIIDETLEIPTETLDRPTTDTATLALATVPAALTTSNGQGQTGPVQQNVGSTQAVAQSSTPEQTAPVAAAPLASKESRSETQRLSAQVTDTPQELISRPSNTLAAVSAVASQTEKQRAVGNTVVADPERSTESSGNLLLNSAAKKVTANGNNIRGNAAQAAPTTAAGTEPSATPSSQSLSFPASMAAAQPSAAATNRTAMGLPTRSPEMAPLNSISGGSTAGSAAAGTARIATPPPPAPIPLRVLTEQIAVQIQKSVGQGLDRIKIQLKPAELGRVEIKLDVMQDGRVAASVIVDRPETLEMLQRDARGLQQALQDAGLKSDGANLSFNLSGRGASDGQQSAEGNGGPNGNQNENADSELAAIESETLHRRASDSMIDVEV